MNMVTPQRGKTVQAYNQSNARGTSKDKNSTYSKSLLSSRDSNSIATISFQANSVVHSIPYQGKIGHRHPFLMVPF